jgi:hypothetical protein
MPEEAPVSVRLPKPVLAALETARRHQTRSRSSQVLHYLRRCLHAEGFLPSEQDVPNAPAGKEGAC